MNPKRPFSDRVASALSWAHLVGLIKPKTQRSAEPTPPAARPPATKASQASRAAPPPAIGARPSADGAGPPRAAGTLRPAVRATADDPDAELESGGSPIVLSARRRERERCAAILGCQAASTNFEMAKSLAFETRVTRREAIALLESSPPAPEAGMSWQRSQDRARRNPRVGSDGPKVSPQAAIASSWNAAFAKANPMPAHGMPSATAPFDATQATKTPDATQGGRA
jgi:hypothetical protein